MHALRTREIHQVQLGPTYCFATDKPRLNGHRKNTVGTRRRQVHWRFRDGAVGVTLPKNPNMESTISQVNTTQQRVVRATDPQYSSSYNKQQVEGVFFISCVVEGQVLQVHVAHVVLHQRDFSARGESPARSHKRALLG